MPAIFKIRSRIRTLLSPAVSKIQFIGIIAWLCVLSLDLERTLNLPNLLTTTCLLLTWNFHRTVGKFIVWRLLGGVYVFALSFGFSTIIHNDLSLRAFALPLAVIIVIGSAILFFTALDYLLSSAQVWLFMWPYLDAETYHNQTAYLLLFCISSMCVGFTLSFTYLRGIRSVLLIESEFRTLAETDFLTSLLNRRALMQNFQQLLKEGKSGYFIMLDIDSFKLKNDQYGHDVGDKILCTMADCLKTTIGSQSVGRIGGEEFGVLIIGNDDSVADEYVLRLLANIRLSISSPHNFTCSAGLAKFSKSSNISEVLKSADKNMYDAKHNGKDRAFRDRRQIIEI